MIEVIKERALAWGQEVADRLDHERPGWSATFLDDSGITQYASQYGQRDLVRNRIERWLMRLRELLNRLG